MHSCVSDPRERLNWETERRRILIDMESVVEGCRVRESGLPATSISLAKDNYTGPIRQYGPAKPAGWSEWYLRPCTGKDASRHMTTPPLPWRDLICNTLPRAVHSVLELPRATLGKHTYWACVPGQVMSAILCMCQADTIPPLHGRECSRPRG